MWDLGCEIWDLGLGEEQEGWGSHVWMWEVCAEEWAAWMGSRLEEQEDEESGARSSGRAAAPPHPPSPRGSALWDQLFENPLPIE